jgi:hypothetical protein
MDARVPEWQLERAWAEHEPARRKIPPEAWRSLRNFKRVIQPQNWLVEMACTEHKIIRELMFDYARKKAVGKERAFVKLVKHFHPATVDRFGSAVRWEWLQPRGAVLAEPETPGEEQAAILTRFGMAWESKKQLVAFAAFGIEAPDHAVARLLQRAPGIDLAATLLAAQRRFFEADSEVVRRHCAEGSSFFLEAGPGLMIARSVRAETPSGCQYFYARCKTWIGSDMARHDQVAIAPAAGAVAPQLVAMTLLALKGGPGMEEL